MQKIKKSKKEGLETQIQIDAVDIYALFESNWDNICHMLYSMIGDWDDAQDLCMETYTELYRKPPKVKTNLRGWLYRVASRKALNFLRAAKRRQIYEIQAGKLSFESNMQDNPVEILVQKQERQKVRSILGKMNIRSAQLLVLRHSGLSYKEIADALDMNPNSIGTLLVRAEAEFLRRYLSSS